MFIGVYNLANFVTLLGLSSAVVACFAAASGAARLAMCMFLLAGLCAMFDGRIARGAGSRTRKEKVFGIQIDTVCDMVSFGLTPVIIVYFLGFKRWHDIAVYIIYASCAAIRLAYFNTQAIEETPDLNMKAFTGVPTPFSCIILPPLIIFGRLMQHRPLLVNLVTDVLILAVGIAFIINVRVKKLGIFESALLIIFEAMCVTLLFVL